MAAIRTPLKSTTVRKQLGLALLRARFRLGSWLAPASTLRSAFDLFGTPMARPRAKAHALDAAGARSFELPFGDERLTVYSWGDTDTQPRVLLAHGWSSFGLWLLPWVAPLRRAGFAVIAFDQPAHGRSTGRRAHLPMFADGVACVAGQFGALAGVVGHSLGGAATAVALSRGLPADRAVLLAPAADPVAAAWRFGGVIGLAQHLCRRIFDEFQARNAVSVEAFQAQVTAPRIARPALVVHDLEDREVPWAEGERYARYWPRATLLSTTGLGHHRIANDPGVIADAIAFLQGRPVGQRVVSTPDLPFGVC
ncbi:alpha/beta hydrolase [Luteimonas deserti]|uniref:Alpha/beta fold hydrolase n=1 Tax=Luteimonas deserti TaxID=2752306 RepID=A0A7Z0TWB8_9GAMM|nr:alpha/beta hydrolase [Luteimonas deserti]NYZ63169.1 alpha/beta fold hydrolase [Luteimonas deserti]